MRLKLVPPELCTDNAAMIGMAAQLRRARRLSRLPGPRCLRLIPTARTGASSAPLCATAATSAMRRCEWSGRSAPRRPVRLELVDIEADQDLHRRYLERIPVAELAGRVSSWATRRPCSGSVGGRYFVAVSPPTTPAKSSGSDVGGAVPIEDTERLLARRRRTALALYLQTSDPGAEDGGRDDLLEGASRSTPTSTRPRSAATSRASASFGKRGVGSLVESLVEEIRRILRPRGNTTSRSSAPAIGPGDRVLGYLCRPRFPDRRRLRRRPGMLGSKIDGIPVQHVRGPRSASFAPRKIVVRRARGFPTNAAQESPTSRCVGV